MRDRRTLRGLRVGNYPGQFLCLSVLMRLIRLRRIKELHNVNDAKARDIMIKLDKKRSSYYKFHYASQTLGVIPEAMIRVYQQ